jgi:hypothetical protein
VSGAIGVCWLLALLLERGRAPLGHVARAGALVGLAASVALPSAEALVAAALFTALAVVDAMRRDDPRIGVAASCSVQLVVVQVALLVRLDTASVGLVLCVAAVVWAGLAGVVPDRWRVPFLVATGLGVGSGLVVSASDPQYFGDAIVITGALMVAAAIATRVEPVAHPGGVLVIVGSWVHLATTGVVFSEPYVLPVAAHLVIAGARARHLRSLSSWVAYGPAIGLLGITALDERLAGGAGWHALVAGGVGVTAVAVGGWRRLSGPLFLGTALVVAVTIHETLAAVVSVPTWAWLGTGGAMLLALGVQLERTDTSPVEAGRRVVDVMAERFT